jgi:16S rRNA (guanine1207-N2)-methyltransferase
LREDERFATILTNPPIRAGRRVVMRFVGGAPSVLEPGGELRMVVARDQGARTYLERMGPLFAEVEVVAKRGGYWVLRGVV